MSGDTKIIQRRSGAEWQRLQEDAKRASNWKRWGPYLSERQWATVREDYSPYGTCWDYFPHDHARSRAYRWGEDGLMGITDREGRLCFALALWNGKDPILKERLFGLTGPQGNHGEDVKEVYFYLDSTPTHSYLKALYKYPQSEYPYAKLVEENQIRGKEAPEYELEDTGAFDESRYFDVFVEYAKGGPNDILIQITVHNRGPEKAPIHVLPTLWFRNTWVWGCTHEGCSMRPRIEQVTPHKLALHHESLHRYYLEFEAPADGQKAPFLFTDNETNFTKLFNTPNASKYVKDAFHDYVISGKKEAVNPKLRGTKAAPHCQFEIEPGGSRVIRLRLYAEAEAPKHAFGPAFTEVFSKRLAEADEFYNTLKETELDESECGVVRQAYAGLLWTKQFYHYVVEDWLKGDADVAKPPESRLLGRNHDWSHLYSRDVLSMPDKWEYPWFAAWDLAFHMLPFAKVDPEFAKGQLLLLLREWYMHPNGQIPAYEFAMGDVNPPVHAWAVWRVYKISAKEGERDRDFLESAFQKLLLNFTWWVNRKDATGKNLFSGGFLGLDNIGVFDRSRPLPTGGTLQQADGTAWMAFYCTTMLAMALELAKDGDKIRPAYSDMASKFFEHFVQIADSMNTLGGSGLWDEEDGFYYDRIHTDSSVIPLKTRSLVGLLPLIAVEVLEEEKIRQLPGFYKRFTWFMENRKDLARHISSCDYGEKLRLLAIPSRDQLERVLRYLLDETEFLSNYGIRSMSKFHEASPFILQVNGDEYRVDYLPGESNSWLFGGNSNWRGPIWFPVNYLLTEALERYYHFYGNDLLVECPVGSGQRLNLQQVADEIDRRLASIFLKDKKGERPCHNGHPFFNTDPHWKKLVLFHEYFHAETGQGLGASHQTGWTALSIRHIEDYARDRLKQWPEQ
jgi:hypothetical protein